MFLESKVFRIWLLCMLLAWGVLFGNLNSLEFLRHNWYYPATMVVGAFVAGSTPEGGGAVAFPVLSIFLNIDRVLARDFSLMIQSVGMTSASIFILTNRQTDIRAFRPLLWWVPVAAVGFVLGMVTLQGLRVPIIQATFLGLITSFSAAYYWGKMRGHRTDYQPRGPRDLAETVGVLLLGGLCTSLFGTGLDILIYTILVTRFRLNEKLATEMSVIMMAAMSLFGFAYRGLYQGELTANQIRTWLCAYPVVLFMAPLGALVLKQVSKELLLRCVVVLNVAQLAYFNFFRPTIEKTAWSVGISLAMFTFFWILIATLSKPKLQPVTS